MHAATAVVLLALIASPAFAVPITAAKPAGLLCCWWCRIRSCWQPSRPVGKPAEAR
ncbi:hypothetical protein DL93DRAFT_2087046 [Clavulina sp. PMI_390]|nr:hypothetical protein DL93DRAFT_2087046 [Clavulina sp. PMI_390]